MSNTKIFSLVTLAFLFFSINLVADTIKIGYDTSNINISKNSKIYFDKNSQKNLNQVLYKEFIPVLNDGVNYGYVFKDTIWVKFTVTNTSDKDILKYLVYNNPNTDIVNLHYYKNSNRHTYKGGILNRKSFKSELSFNFPLALKAYETQTYYLEIKSITHSLHFDLKIEDYDSYKTNELHHQLILGCFFTCLMVIMIYNSVIFFISRNTIYIYYALFIASIVYHQLSLTGMIYYILPTDQHIYKAQSYMPLYNMFIVFSSLFIFVRKFLNLHLYKKIDTGFKFLYLISIAIVLLHSKDFYLLQGMVFIAITFLLYLEIISFYLFVKTKEKNAKYFFLIWSISIIGMLWTILYYAGILPVIVPYIFVITLFIESLSFSIVIASEINHLQKEKLLLSIKVSEQSKHASMGEMLRNIAHQWRQPLSEINAVVMKIDADFYKKRLTKKTIDSDLQRIENITLHLSETIDSFNSYFKTDKEVHDVNIEELITNALNIIANRLDNIAIKLNIDDQIQSKININELIQVILIILNNAADALELSNTKEKLITITAKKLDAECCLEIKDNAGGIKKENLDKIFEPYFSTKFKSDGIGIGLYMAKILVEKSLQGSLSVENTQNGARFKIVI